MTISEPVGGARAYDPADPPRFNEWVRVGDGRAPATPGRGPSAAARGIDGQAAPPHPARKPRRWRAGLLTLGLLIGGSGGYLLTSGQAPGVAPERPQFAATPPARAPETPAFAGPLPVRKPAAPGEVGPPPPEREPGKARPRRVRGRKGRGPQRARPVPQSWVGGELTLTPPRAGAPGR